MFTLKEFLDHEVKPALGCTEPGAVALAVARARRELPSGEPVTRIEVKVSDSIYKNGMDVGIPGAQGAKGNTIAAALGAICGNPDLGLEVLKACAPPDLQIAEAWILQGIVRIKCLPEYHGVYIEATVYCGEHYATCLLEHEHSNIARLVRDGRIILSSDQPDRGKPVSIAEQIKELNFHQLISLVEQIDPADVDYIMEGVRLNVSIAEFGLSQDFHSGLGLGHALHHLIANRELSDDLGYLIKSYCYAAADARMSGAELPVMSSAGSGNNGITAILPLALAGQRLNKGREELALAIAISHLATSYIKSKIGRLSPVCGCAVAAGAGAAAGLAFLLGGGETEAAQAIQTVLAGTSGLVCDGAKESCSLKVGVAAGEAYLAALLALDGKGVNSPQGVVDLTVEQTTDNLGRLNREGMKDMDRVMIEILEARNQGL